MTQDPAPQHMVFRNGSRERTLAVLLEPWGMPLELPPGAVMEARVVGALGPLELDLDERGLTLHGASGSRIAVRIDGVDAYSTLEGPEVPATPSGASVRSFLKGIFGG